MTVTQIAILFWTTDFGHLGDLVIAFAKPPAAKGDDQDTQMTKIGRPRKEGDLVHGHRIYPSCCV